jgi:hypothetical protein
VLFCFITLFITHVVHNVAATVSYDQKELLDIRTAITHLEMDKSFFFNESEAKDTLLSGEQAQIPVICVKSQKKGAEVKLPSENLWESESTFTTIHSIVKCAIIGTYNG